MKKHAYLLLLLAAAVLNACTSGDNDKAGTIRLAEGMPARQTLPADQTRAENAIRFYADGYWSIGTTFSDGNDQPWKWLTLDRNSGGAGDHALGMTLQPNTTGETRSAEIAIECNGSMACIVVEQSPQTASGETA